MNAQEARKIAKSNLQGPLIDGALQHCYRLIQVAAAKGQTRITNPISGRAPLEWYDFNFKKALYLALQKEGYKIVHHPDPDPGHPCCAPYTTISW